MPMTAEQLDYQQRSARTYQERYDLALKQVGMRAPQPVLGQHPDDYRREVLRTIKKTFLGNHELGRINMRGLPSEVLPQFESQVLDAAVKEAYNPNSVPPGEMRRVERLDQTGRVSEICWIGPVSFVRDMGRPGRRVVSITTDRGRWNAKSGAWF
jgi:hypothetical protein